MKLICTDRPVLLFRCILPLILAFGSFSTFAARQPYELKDGDRVALIGDTLIEREQSYGYLEERLTVQFPGRNIQFRNLGWSADTPEGISRASFDWDKPGKGFEQLTNQIAAVQPTVVIFGYGMANSFDGEAGVAQFESSLNKLVDAVQAICTNQPVRMIFLSPIRHERLGHPLPDPTAHNKQLALYTRAVLDVATERKGLFISLYNNLLGDGTESHPSRPFTDDGIHLTAYGYLRMSEAVEKGLAWEPNFWRVRITADGQVTPGSYGTIVTNLSRTRDSVRFSSQDEILVSPYVSDKAGHVPSADAMSLLQIDDLKPGRYELRVDGKPVASAKAEEWAEGVEIDRGPQFNQAQELRKAILKKNELYFDRSRPENETYLLGFRKYEQGQNAKEIPEFDPLIAKEEAEIATLRKPAAHTYELTRASRSFVRDETSAPKAQTELASTAKPLEPLPQFDVAPGFEVSLYAESPMLAKPIQMNFDPSGRLWVANSSIYPQIKPGQIADDKIIVLEDTKGVGKVDKSRVFVDGLMIPTAVEPGDGGVYVGQGTKLLFFKDTTGAGRADQKRIVLSGFGTEDAHHLIHTLRWGYDGQLYFDQSIYIHTHIETPYDVERLNSGGIWHLRTATMQLGVFLRGFCNPWGHQFDAFGQSFVTDGAGFQGLSWGIPGATYFTYADMRRELQSISPGSYPKFCSLELIRSKQFPDDWQGNAITCDFRAHRVVRFAIDEKDSGYATREMPDLLRSTNVTFRPIDVKLGPDGALYIADWSNPIIQHGEVDFRDPRRDHEHGRIWRVTAKGRALNKRINFTRLSNRELLDQLLSPNAYNQDQARRVLTERGNAVLPDLAKWTDKQKQEGALLQALWMYESLDVVQPGLLQKLLSAHDPHIRAAATRVVSNWHSRLANALDLLTQTVRDTNPRVRVESVRALAQIPSPRSVELVLEQTEKPMDTFLDYAAWLSINDLAEIWVAAVKSGEWKSEGKDKELEYGLRAIKPVYGGQILADEFKTRTIPRDGSGPWIELIGKSGEEAEVVKIFNQATDGGFDAKATEEALKAVAQASRDRGIGKTGDSEKLVPLFTNASARLEIPADPPSPVARIQEASLRLAGAWQRTNLIPQIVAVINDKKTSASAMKAAVEGLREMGGEAASAPLEQLAKQSEDKSVRVEAALAYAALDVEKAQPYLISMLDDAKTEKEAKDLWHSVLAIKGASTAIAKALPTSGLPPIMAKAGLREAREGGRNETDLVVALTRGADLESQGLGLTDDEMKQIAERAAKEGDPERGETIFRRKDIACINCHAIGGVGGKVGPDLTSIGASAQPDYLVESVIYPNRKIKEGYHSVLVETKDGEELSGILVRENTDQLVLRDSTDKEITIAKNNIKNRTLGNSLMPSGLIDSLNTKQQLDLYRFLIELGKPGSFDASKGNVARLWKLYPKTLDVSQFGDEKILNTALSDAKWTTVFSLVNGHLLKSEMDAVLKPVKWREPDSIFAGTTLQISGAGDFEFKLEGCAKNTPVWLDGKPMKLSLADGGDVVGHASPAAGAHSVIIKLNAAKLPDWIKLDVLGGTFLVN